MWHYTIDFYLDSILKDGQIRPGKAWFGERPAVWFSSNPVGEKMANQTIRDHAGRPLETTQQTSVRRARVGVEPATAPYRWKDYVSLSGIDRVFANALYRDSLLHGSKPDEEWFLSFDPVPKNKWVTVELFGGSAWVPYPE